MSLNELYGVCGEAGAYGIANHETVLPSSRVTLTEETAPMIRSFFQVEQPQQKLFTPIPRSVHVLWLIDCAGAVHLALEEMVDNEGTLLGVLAKAAAAQPPKGFKKLGHPTLLSEGEVMARIAGEIYYDPEADKSGSGKLWCLTNDSGRYGLREGQTREHLEAACRYFEKFHLYFSTRYTKPRA
ncbi:hypothetical protein E5S70_04950 [Ensifer adhaerens]|uniref:hypothetical protein n=1 Tax=Ensifer canadensis TaxID=555315 RepID=UPI0014901165|nr:hypothetical protein [Ensifer canadensis]NOV15442.1 hypothetical protein [Ensifer canadensis]